MTQPEDKNDDVEQTPETPEVEVDQQARADEEAARAAAAAEEAAAAAADAPTEVAEAAAEEAEELAEKAEEAAEAAAEAPKPKKARKAREAEQAAEQAEEAADEAKKSARRIRGRRGREDKPAETTRTPASAPVGLKVSAQAKYVRTSARKARLVCDHIRGKDVEEARAILAFTTRDAAKAWSKLLESAVANAENNHDLVGEELRIYNVHADEGPTLKRYRPRAMGRATRIRKRTSHLSITLISKES
jgi:ribosomal protein L22